MKSNQKKAVAAIDPILTAGFKSTLFMVIAILLSVVFVATLALVITSAAGIAFILGAIFSGVSALCAWLLFATNVGKGKIKNLRLHLAYSKIINTIALVFVYIIGITIIVACIAPTALSGVIRDKVVPFVNDEVKPMIQEFIDNKEDLLEF